MLQASPSTPEPVAIDAADPIFGEVSNIVAQAQALAGPGAVVVTARVQRQVAGLFVVNERGSHRLKDVPEAVTLYRIVRATSGEHPRPDYHRLIVRAVNTLGMSTAEARQAVYERARKAAVAIAIPAGSWRHLSVRYGRDKMTGLVGDISDANPIS